MSTQHATNSATVNDYFSPRDKNDIDLVSVLRQVFVEEGFTDEKLSIFDANEFVVNSKNKQPHVQRFLLNRFWYNQLVSLETDTMPQRSCLVADGTEDDWLRLIMQFVVPFAKQNGLPVQIE